MTDAGLTVTAREVSGSIVVLTVAGEIDRDSVFVLAEAGGKAIEQGHHRLVLDLAAVTFCDSAGLSTLLDLRKSALARDGSVRLAGAGLEVLTVLRVTNLERLFPLYATAEEALTAE